MKNIFSFALYGKNDRYCLGILLNIDFINKYYNDWEIYIYYSEVPQKILDEINKKQHVKMIKCDDTKYIWEGMFWRFYPFMLDDVDIFLSRDADSLVSEREMNLVDNWIKSDKCFHIIRDHPRHTQPIMGGMFGVKIKEFQQKYGNIDIDKNIIFYKRQFNRQKKRNVDQLFLSQKIYPKIQNDNMTHVSDLKNRKTKNDILIPRVDNFIGKANFKPTYTFENNDS